MENLNERAANYAAEKVNELLAKAIAQAYKDGYNNGYKECADDYDIDLYEDVDFVDLDLPSGLLWSSRYRMGEENKPLYLTYEEPLQWIFQQKSNLMNWLRIAIGLILWDLFVEVAILSENQLVNIVIV